MAISTMYPAMPGSPKAELSVELSASGTTMTLTDASVLPPAPNLCVLGDDSTAEVVLYNSISGNVVSGLVRAQGGTTASVWPSGTSVARNYTSFDHDRFISNIQDLEDNKLASVSWGDIQGDLADQTDLQSALDAKQDELTFDTVPTENSTNPVESGGVFAAIKGIALHISMPSTSSLGTITNSDISTTMRVVNIVWGTPSNVTSDISWNTDTAGQLVLTGSLSGATTAEIDLVDFG